MNSIPSDDGDKNCVLKGQQPSKSKRSLDETLDKRAKRSLVLNEMMVESHIKRNSLIEEQSEMAIVTMVAHEGDEVAAKILKMKKLRIFHQL